MTCQTFRNESINLLFVSISRAHSKLPLTDCLIEISVLNDLSPFLLPVHSSHRNVLHSFDNGSLNQLLYLPDPSLFHTCTNLSE